MNSSRYLAGFFSFDPKIHRKFLPPKSAAPRPQGSGGPCDLWMPYLDVLLDNLEGTPTTTRYPGWEWNVSPKFKGGNLKFIHFLGSMLNLGCFILFVWRSVYDKPTNHFVSPLIRVLKKKGSTQPQGFYVQPGKVVDSTKYIRHVFWLGWFKGGFNTPLEHRP